MSDLKPSQTMVSDDAPPSSGSSAASPSPHQATPGVPAPGTPGTSGAGVAQAHLQSHQDDAHRRPHAPLRSFSQELDELVESAKGQAITVNALVTATEGRGVAVVIIFLSLPFVFPVSIPFLSTPFGLTIAFLGLRLSMGLKPWLPRFIRGRLIPFETLKRIAGLGKRISRPIEKLLRPRLGFLFWTGAWHLHGIGIALAASALCLPLPIPLSNLIPAFGIVLLAAGWMERDGLAILIGHVMGLLAWVYMYVFLYFGKEAVVHAFDWLFGA